VIVNPISGERIVVRQSGAETSGALFSFDLYLPPGGHVPAGHVHPVQEERFTVIEGQMRFRLGRQTILARPGETVIVPPGKAHWFGAEGGQAAHAYVEARPALRMEEFFAENETLSLAGRLGGTRLPRLPDLARILLEFRREVAVPYAPAFLVRAALTTLAWLGRRRVRVHKAAPQHGSE
jgi:quercetin dioxygenase-like cupin family protein